MITPTSISTPEAPTPAYAFPQGKSVGGFVQVSGQGGTDGAVGADNAVAAQTVRALDRVTAILKAGGSSLEHTLTLRVYLGSRDDFVEMCTAYDAYMITAGLTVPPCRTTVMVELPTHDMRVEIDALGMIV